MGLLDDLKDDSKLVDMKRSICTVCKLLSTLEKAEKEALLARMDNQDVSHASISRVLRSNGYNISEGTLGRHRKDGCQRVLKG